MLHQKRQFVLTTVALRILLLFIYPLSYASEPSKAQAVQEGRLSLEDAFSQGFSHNPQWQLAQASLPVANAQIITAAARSNPSFISQANFAEQNLQLGIQQTIRVGGEREKLVEVAQAQRNQTTAMIKAAALDLRYQIYQAYVALFMAQQQADALQTLLSVSKTLVDVTSKREQAGDVAKLDVWQVEVQSLRVENQYQMLQVEVQQAMARLNLLLNNPVTNPVTLEALKQPQNIATQPLEGYIDTALRQRPELEKIGYQYNEAKAQEGFAMAQRIPDVTVGAGPAYSRPEGSTHLFVNLQVQMPVFYQYKGEHETAKAQQVQAKQQQRSTENQIKTDVSTAFYDVQLQHQLWERYHRQLLPKAQHVNEKAALSFREGKSSILVPLQAQQAYIETRINTVLALGNYYLAWARLERAVGGAL